MSAMAREAESGWCVHLSLLVLCWAHVSGVPIAAMASDLSRCEWEATDVIYCGGFVSSAFLAALWRIGPGRVVYSSVHMVFWSLGLGVRPRMARRGDGIPKYT
jgi:hypothetical protein